MSQNVYITHAYRSAIGNFMGGLSSLSAVTLGSTIVKFLLGKSQISPDAISEMILGQVLTGGAGQNPARQTLIHSGLPYTIPAFTVGKVCGSGLKAIGIAYESIISGNNDLVIAGGQESMSQSMHALYMRQGMKFGDTKLTDMMMLDGLTDAFSGQAMGITAENIAAQFNINRLEQDEFAFNSHQRALAAQNSGKFKDEIVPIKIINKKEEFMMERDEFVKPNTSLETLAKLKPAFLENGTVTAGNSSGINDGAAMVMLASEKAIKKYNLVPLVKINGYASAGVDPNIMGTGPIAAIPKLLGQTNTNISAIDLFEINEAFAAQSISVIRELKLDMAKVNVNGGAVALGHPIGASGARVAVTLIHEMLKSDAKKAIASLCIGGGMGIAMLFEKV